MNVDELLEQYMNDPKWKGKLFMDDEKTCYIDGLLVGLNLTEQLKQQILSLENDLMVARKDRDYLKDVIATGIEEFMKDNPCTSLQFLADKKSIEMIEQYEKIICELQSEISSLKVQNNSNGCAKDWVLR